jgi:thymidylate kinase
MRDETSIGAEFDTPVNDLLLQVIVAIFRQNIRCCYWKSTTRLAAALAGETDLDLLVSRHDQHRLQACLLANGLKLFPTVPSRSDQAMINYLGYDEPSGLIVHVHIHTHVVSGYRLLSEYRLPWAEKILERSVPHPRFPVNVPDPATEAVLLITRGLLELRRSDPVTARNWNAMRRKFDMDHQALAERVDPASLRARSAELMGEPIAERLAAALTDRVPLERQHGLRRLVRKTLGPHRVFNSIETAVRAVTRGIAWVASTLNQRYLHLPRPLHRVAPGGGIVVALMGVDGSGKSTAVAGLRRWLGTEVDTMPIYFGTGDGRPSLILLPLKLLVPLFTRLTSSRPRGSSHGNVSSQPPGLIYSLLLTLWSFALAIEKRHKLIQARRAADRGMVVIADRYPQDQLASFNDGPLLPRLMRVPRWLRQFEASAYELARRVPPDLVIKLTASPDLIAKREPTMDRDVIRQRTAELQMLAFPDSTVVCIDAAQPLDSVIRQIKNEVWRHL